jgi:hypothetical protein
MIRSIALSAALATSLAATGAQAADTTDITSDVRCMVVAAAMAQNTDPKVQNAGLMAGLYYLGKLDGREPNLDLEARLKQELAQMKPAEMVAEAQRCGAQLTARGKTVTDIGARLQAGKAP